MIPVTSLPTLNATLNSLSAILLLAGYYFIRRGERRKHMLCMLGAFIVSTVFLISYLIYHYHVGSRAFTGTGAIRILYFAILLSHTILAVVIVPLVIKTLRRAYRNDFVSHVRVARRTFPIGLYVSVTGVIVYWMLYQM
jgi:putative membrane protein